VRSSYPHQKVNGIVNLSNHVLTVAEIEILSLGHSFVSKPALLNSNRTKKQLNRVVYNKPAIEEILSDLSNIEFSSNLKKFEITALVNLKNNPEIIITKADKGDSWVLLNKADYIWECQRQLSDVRVYRPLEGPQVDINIKLFKNVLISMLRDKVITAAVFQKLSVEADNLRYRIFYTLPKIHKPSSSWSIKHKIPPGRPIVGNSYSEDTEICKFIDSFLKPIVAKQPFVLSNTDQLLYALANLSIKKEAILFSLDVNSLYTNIPIAKGIETVKYFFDKYPDQNRSDKHILSLLSISLYKNDFVFNGKYFRQTKGVAMGKQFAPNFANLYMSRWENHVLNELSGLKPIIWLRYIDDIFGIWEHSLTDLLTFIGKINKIDENIQVLANTSFSDIQFLDLVLFKTQESNLSSMVYLKPTSSLKLIHPRSLHPSHTKNGVIVSQILRYSKNCSFEVDFRFQLKFLLEALSEQCYSRTCLRQAKQKAFSYTNHTVDNKGAIVKGFFPCSNKCSLCINHGQITKFLSFSGGAKMIFQFLTCSSKNLIYVIECQKCFQKYVGETSRSLKKRMSEHLSNIRLKYETPVGEHFNQADHCITDVKFFALVSNPSWSEVKRKTVENKWIDKLQTLKPNGINCDINKINTKFVTVPFKGRKSLPNSLHYVMDENTKSSFTTGSPLRVSFNHKHKIAREMEV